MLQLTNTEVAMKHLSFTASAIVLSAALFAAPASALPVHPVAGAHATAIVQVLCKYGTPHCIDPHRNQMPTFGGGTRLPDSGWSDPDCKYYGNCSTGTPGSWGDPAAARSGSSMPYAGQPRRMYR
jgi:hypothetical protein